MAPTRRRATRNPAQHVSETICCHGLNSGFVFLRPCVLQRSRGAGAAGRRATPRVARDSRLALAQTLRLQVRTRHGCFLVSLCCPQLAVHRAWARRGKPATHSLALLVSEIVLISIQPGVSLLCSCGRRLDRLVRLQLGLRCWLPSPHLVSCRQSLSHSCKCPLNPCCSLCCNVAAPIPLL